jgi:hypothetical protein
VVTIWAALIGALVIVAGYYVTQAQALRERRAKVFAEALAAVEDYMETPYRIRRRPRSDVDTRERVTSAISDIQSRIAFHEAWLRVETPTVAAEYSQLVRAARAEAGANMTVAWAAPLLDTDAAMSLGTRYGRDQTDAARDRVVTAMTQHLRWFAFQRFRPRPKTTVADTATA